MEITRDEIQQSDVQIVDRQYLEPDQVNQSFYHELIRNCIEKLQTNSNVIQPATRMVDIVAKKRKGRFIYCRHVQGGPIRFYLLSREEAVAKLGSDLTKRLNEMNKEPTRAQAPAMLTKPPEAKPKALQNKTTNFMSGFNPQHRYAMQLVLKVCMAEADGRFQRTPLEVARLLNNPVLHDGETETLKQRKLRMQLRLRFLAVARTEKSVFVFARNLLRRWGIEITWKKHLVASSIPGFRFEKDDQGFPKSMPPALLQPERKRAAVASATNSDDNFKTGAWSQEEKVAFVRLVDKYGWGRWNEFTGGIPTR